MISKLRGFRMVVHDKLLPPFNSIADEANAVAEEEYRRLDQMPGDDSVDMVDLAEQAHDEGLAYYETVTGVQQALIAILAIAVYHLVEQELISFLRRELLDHREESGQKKLSVKEVSQRLLAHGIELASFVSYLNLDELRLVADTVKHAEGGSSEKLYKLRPEMITHPFVRQAMPGREWIKTPVHTPLTGDDFYVTMDDLDAYFDAGISFYEELATALEAQVS